MKTKFTLAVLTIVLVSCGKSSDPSPATSANAASATIGGQTFTATDTKTTDTGNGLEIRMTSGDQIITLVTDDKKAGTYTIINASGRVQAGTAAYATYTKGTDTYLSKDGSVVIAVDASGGVSGTFTVTVKNAAGTTVPIVNGKLTGLTLATLQLPAGQCLIASSTFTGASSNDSAIPVYNSEGKLLKVFYDDGTSDLYLWANGVVVSNIYAGKTSTSKSDWFYTSGKLTKVIRTDSNDPTTTRTSTYTLNAAGQPIQVDYGTFGKFTYTYDANGNCTSANFGNNSNQTYSNYDNKPNPNTFIAASLGVTFLTGSEGGSAFSKNNLGTRTCASCSPVTVNYTYTYNAKGNVVTQTSSEGTSQTLTYVGCN